MLVVVVSDDFHACVTLETVDLLCRNDVLVVVIQTLGEVLQNILILLLPTFLPSCQWYVVMAFVQVFP